MRRDPLERLTIRAALVLGFGSLVALWVMTGWTISGRLADLEAQTSAVTARYIRAQDLLSSIRTELNLSSIVLRDALLDTHNPGKRSYESRIASHHATIVEAIRSYEPVVESEDTRSRLDRLAAEVEIFWDTTRRVLSEEAPGDSAVRLLNEQITPRRAAAEAISYEIRDLNEAALVQHQEAVATLYRDAERQWRWRLGFAFATSIGIGLVAVIYAGRLEDRLRRQRARDQQNARELQQLSARLVSAQEEERRVIARELHDEVGQVLGAIKVDLLLAQRALEQRGIDARTLDEPQQMADSALRTVRDLSQLLRPAVLDDLGLAPAVDFLLRSLERRHQMQATLVQDGPIPRLSPAVEVAAFRVIQEGLTNVARHAGASRCTVRLASDTGGITIGIEDDGHGFDPDAASQTGRRGLGLIGMRERVAERGGTFTLTSAPGQGTRIRVRLPFVHDEEEAREPDRRADFGALGAIGAPAQPGGVPYA